MAFPAHPVGRHGIPAAVHWDSLIEMMSYGFLTIFPFEISDYLVGRYFESM